jgi:hypothetical protein
MRAPETLSMGLQKAPDRGCFRLQTLSAIQHMHERRSGLPVPGYISIAAESQITQLDSQGRDTKIKKIDTKTKF